jgi:5-methylcytosine-specific restriction enzyme A
MKKTKKVYRMSYIPPASDYLGALEISDGQKQISNLQKEILLAQYQSPDHTQPASELARMVGYPTIMVNRNYGDLGHKIATILNLNPNPNDTSKHRWWAVLSEGWTDKKFQWKMHDSVVQAIEQLGWHENNIATTEEIAPVEIAQLWEGAIKKIAVNVYERNPRARQMCIAHYGLHCQVCGFNFEEVYGELGQGFIHVHHLKPLHEVGQGYQVDPIADLVPVCANCHAMLHRPKTILTIDQLQKQLTRN